MGRIWAICVLGIFVTLMGTKGVASEDSESIEEMAQRFEANFLDLGQKKESQPLPRIEIVVVIDSSESVGTLSFLESTKFVRNFLCYFSISPASTNVAVLKSSTVTTPIVPFDGCTNKDCITELLNDAKYDSDASDIKSALKEVHSLFKEFSNDKSQKVVVLISDGKWDKGGSPDKAIEALKKDFAANVFVFEFGNDPEEIQLKNLAPPANYFAIRNATELRKLHKNVATATRFDQCDQPGNILYDECGRKCSCVNGKLTDCCRVRKEITSMTEEERTRYLQAFKLMTTDRQYSQRYDRLASLHKEVFSKGIFKKDQFLPWHRWYLLQLENLLREIDCHVTIPYWAWSFWSHNAWNETLLWNEEDDGLGGNGGEGKDGACVKTGQFSYDVGKWLLPNSFCLERNFNGNPPDAVAVATVLSMEEFGKFELMLRVNLQSRLYCLIGGTMCSTAMSYAPEFPLHQGFVDKIWSDWQERSDENKQVYFPSIDGKMTNLEFQRCELMDLDNQPGNVRVCYDDPTVNKAESVSAVLNAIPTKDLQEIPRLAFSELLERSLKLISVSEKEQDKADTNEKVLLGKQKKELNLEGIDATLGFHVEPFPAEDDQSTAQADINNDAAQ